MTIENGGSGKGRTGGDSGHRVKSQSITLDFLSERWSRARKVRVTEVSGDDLVLLSRRSPPLLEEVVQLRSPVIQGASVMLTGRVVGLEVIRTGLGGTKITVELLEPPPDVLRFIAQGVDTIQRGTPPVSSVPRQPAKTESADGRRDSVRPIGVRRPSRPVHASDDVNVEVPGRPGSSDISSWVRSSRLTQKEREEASRSSRRPAVPPGGAREEPLFETRHPSTTATGYSITAVQRAIANQSQTGHVARSSAESAERLLPSKPSRLDRPAEIQPPPPEVASVSSDGATSNGIREYSRASQGSIDLRKDGGPRAPQGSVDADESERPTPPANYTKELARQQRHPLGDGSTTMVDEAPVASSWDPDGPAERSIETPSLGDDEQVVDDLAEALRESAHSIDLGPSPADDAAEVEESRGTEAVLHQVAARAEQASQGLGALLSRREAPVVGIDFGTSYSKIAVFDRGEVVLIEDTDRSASTRATVPSVVALDPTGEFIVGEGARELLAMHPERVISSVKRILGLKYADPLANGLLASLACESVEGPNGTVLFEIGGRQITVPEAASKILEHLIGLATRWAGVPVTRAVMTVPVDFDSAAKRELELAARMAGLEVLAMVPEPAAAVMGCGFSGADGDHLKVAVYDFGGGTFDATIVDVGKDSFEVLGAAGDRWLGGDDLDDVIARHIADRYHQNKNIRLHNRREEFQRLLFACEEGKRLLSALDKVEIIMAQAGHTAKGEQVLLIPLEREVFDDLAQDVVSSSLVICQQAASEANVEPNEVDVLLVTGGTTRIPVVNEAAQSFFGRKSLSGVHPEHAVVIGAALRAAVISGDLLSSDIGQRLRDHGTKGRNIGIAMADGSTEVVIRSDQIPPVAAGRFFNASLEEDATYALELVEGEQERAAENRSLGNFIIQGIPVGPDGMVVINIYFELGTTGTLFVTAQDRLSGQRVQATFELSDE